MNKPRDSMIEGKPPAKNGGNKNGKWKGGVTENSDGYLQIRAGPLRGVYVHILVAEAKLRRGLREGEEVHHRDFDRLNCHPKNLRVLSREKHKGLHRAEAPPF